MKKILAIALSLALVLSLVSAMSLASADKGDALGTEITDWRVSVKSEASKFVKQDNGILFQSAEAAGAIAAANLKEAVTLDGFEFTMTPTMWSMGHWIAFTLSNKADYVSGNTDVNAFGCGLMVICQYVATTDYINIIPYSVNENGFAVGNPDIACIGGEFMYPTESVTVRFEADETYGYIIYINDKAMMNDSGANIDMTRLVEDFPDGKAYFGLSMLNNNGVDNDSILIESVKDGGASAPTPSEPAPSEPAPSAPEESKGGCGNKA
ncbi:MAG: hypothetical protein IKA51_05250 [Clostridia bacterium]|nr:hypothetical protein [Clostridia bacterium]